MVLLGIVVNTCRIPTRIGQISEAFRNHTIEIRCARGIRIDAVDRHVALKRCWIDRLLADALGHVPHPAIVISWVDKFLVVG